MFFHSMYGKIFKQIFDSSIAENFYTRLVFQDLIVLADSDGVVEMTREAIARRTNVPLDIVEKALNELESPDPKSRTPIENGARLVRLDKHRNWGWMIVNYGKFRDWASDVQRRERTRDRVNKFRKKNYLQLCNAHVTLGNACNAKEKEKEKHIKKDGEEPNGSAPKRRKFEKPSVEEVRIYASGSGVTELEADKFFNYYESNGWRVGRNPMVSWRGAFGHWKSNIQKYDSNGKTNRTNPAGRPDRNSGTLNAGTADQYDLSKIQANLKLPNVQRSGTGTATG